MEKLFLLLLLLGCEEQKKREASLYTHYTGHMTYYLYTFSPQ